MKINRLSITNIQGVSALEIKPSAPVILVSGNNFTGKTTTLNAIDMALTGNVSRVRLKKDYKQAVRDGQRVGTALVEWDGGRCAMTLPNGKHEVEGDTPPAALRGMLDMHHFSRLDETARREWLYGVMGLSSTPQGIVANLKGKGLNSDKADEVGRYLTNGFQAGEKYANNQATEHRGAWKAVTGGESYGDKKAEAWAPELVQDVSQADLDDAFKVVEAADAALTAASRELGAMEHKHHAYVNAQRQIEPLKEEAAKIDRFRDKLERDRAELKVWSGKLADLPPVPGAKPITHACPDCGSVLVLRAGKLEHYEDTGGKVDPDVETKRIEQKKAVDLYRNAVDAGERNLAAAQRAAVQAETLAAVEAVGEVEVAAARKRSDEASDAAKAAKRRFDALLEADRASKAAAGRAEKAKAHHLDVQGWIAIAEALSPDGIPSEMISKSLKPLNKLLREYADTTGWIQPVVGVDMSITGDGRLMSLLSESEVWRVDAMLTAALAELSGAKFFALDRLDVLHPSDRPIALMWLSGLAEAGRIDQAWVAGTLKAEPKQLPDGVMCVWLSQEEGVDDAKEAA